MGHEEERWEEIGDGYAVSDLGRIKGPRGLMKAVQHDNGHFSVIIRDEDGNKKTKSIARLVAEAFVRLPDPACRYVKHKDGDSSNNRADNLEWIVREPVKRKRQLVNISSYKREDGQLRIYIAGAITGDPEYMEKFERAARRIEKAGHVPVNPAKLPGGKPYKWYIDTGLQLLAGCDAMYLLSTWRGSRGAKTETDYARAVQLPIFHELTNTWTGQAPETQMPFFR